MKKNKMIRLPAVLVILLVAATAHATEFKLKHEKTGQMYGPFTTDNGSSVKLGSATFTVVSEEGASGVQALRNMVIEDFSLGNNSLQEAAEYIQLYSKFKDPKKQGFVVTVAPGADGKKSPLLSVSAKNISALDALTYISVASGYSFRVSGKEVVFSPRR